MKKIATLLSSFLLMLMVSNVFANMNDVKSEANDTTITTEVKSVLWKRQLINGKENDYNTWNVHVETTHGVVVLTGHVKDEHQKLEAVNATKSVSGVKEVKDELKIQK
jgi:hyperosmotically inducible protein